MKSIREMSDNELYKYCLEQKLKGISYREITAIFEKHGTDEKVKRTILAQLDAFDNRSKSVKKTVKRHQKRKDGIWNLILGLIVLLFGGLLFSYSSDAGVVLVVNVVLVLAGALWTFRGLLLLIAVVAVKNQP